MKAILLSFLLVFLSVSLTLAFIDVPIKHHQVELEILKEQQAKNLYKLGGEKGFNALSKYDPKLTNYSFPTDYITANLSIGSPLQNFNVILSSGSDTFWVFKDTYNKLREGQHKYFPSKSNTSLYLNRAFSHRDAYFKVQGQHYIDNFVFADRLMKEQFLGGVKTLESPVKFPNADGIFGFNHLSPNAYSKLGYTYQAPIDGLLDTVYSKKVGLYLGKKLPEQDGYTPGLFMLGGINEKYCDPDSVTQINLKESPYKDYRFVFEVARASYGEINLLEKQHGFIDTSLSTIILPSDTLVKIFETISPKYDYDLGIYTLDCDTVSNLKTINIYTNDDGPKISIDSQSYLVDIGLESGKCAVALSSKSSDLDYDEDFILGTPVARSHCVVWNHAKNVIELYGIKKQNNATTQSGSFPVGNPLPQPDASFSVTKSFSINFYLIVFVVMVFNHL